MVASVVCFGRIIFCGVKIDAEAQLSVLIAYLKCFPGIITLYLSLKEHVILLFLSLLQPANSTLLQ